MVLSCLKLYISHNAAQICSIYFAEMAENTIIEPVHKRSVTVSAKKLVVSICNPIQVPTFDISPKEFFSVSQNQSRGL